MYLKSVELCGFKSFAERTKLLFEQGITGIIGPNGCGKSNVADAVRWCLGEQSAKSLRSHQMMDVIFNGSQSRATTGMAEVSITFDNSQNVLPIDYSEVTVTRRLFRSGESEYFINKTQCRLKDVSDLFLDTGIGTEGYSIMEQGKVEFILSAKPEQRRELFEEAAGVARYKARREEALRKLEKVDIDMNRVSDMLSLLKEQISSLDSAARKAKQYKKYQEELKKLEISSLVHGIDSCHKEIEKINEFLLPKTAEFEQLNATMDQIDAEFSEIRLLQTQKDDEYIRLQDQLSQFKSGINLADERIQQAARRETELIERQTTLSMDIESSTGMIKNIEEELANIRTMCSELSVQAEKLKNGYIQKEAHLNDIRASMASFHNDENDIRNRLFELASEKTDIHNEHNRLNSFNAHCQAKTDSLAKEQAHLQEQQAPLQQKISETERETEALILRETELGTKIEEIVAKSRQTQTLLNDTVFKSTHVRESVVSLESKLQTIIEMEQKNPYRSAIRSVLALDIPGIIGPLGGLISINQGFEDVVTASLGEKLYYLICDTVQTANKAIEHLKSNELGRVTFIVTENLPDSASNNYLTQVQGTQTLLSMLKYEPSVEKVLKFLCSEVFVSGNTIYGKAVIQGGGKIVYDSTLLIDEQSKNINAQIEEKNRNLEEISAQENRLQSEIESMNAERSSLEFEKQRITIQIENIQNQSNMLKQELGYIEKEISIVNDETVKNREEEVKTVSQMKVLDESLATIVTEEEALKEKQRSLNTELQKFRDEESVLAPVLTESKVAWATQSNELAGRLREEEKLKETVTSTIAKIEQYKTELAINQTRIIEQKTIQESESENLKSLYVKQEEQEGEVQSSLAERQALLERQNEKTNALHEIRHNAEQLKQELHRFDLDKHSFDIRLQNFTQKLQEEHSAVFEEVKELYLSTPPQEEEILRIKKRIESIGPVNLAAPEEYASLEERFNFLQTQQQDLLKAKEDLLEVINKINKTTKENFKITFDKVRENFKNIYQQLFEGGQADIVLTEESNMLESGVDIMAQPPGKKPQSISQLSGGEKALTAIALLFAFFMVRPSPFCILDEVDAPLDEANVGRFINMVKSFSKQSQFLVVTHNKRTMEMANVLYGVTMEELGVSKIISVRLHKDEELAASA
jgi:chromosome segregation protein